MASKAEPAPPAFGEALARAMAPERCSAGPAGGPGSTGGSRAPGTALTKSQTGFTGVTLHKRTQRYESHIWHDKKQIYLGSYNLAGQAARVHDITALRVKGAAAAELNYPRDDYAELAPHLETICTTDLVLALRSYSKSLNATGYLGAKTPGSGPPTPQHAAVAPPPPSPAAARGRKRKQARPSSALDSYDAPGCSDEEEVEDYGSGSQAAARRGGPHGRSPAPAASVSPSPPPAPRPAMPLFRTRQQTATATAGGLPPISPLARPAAALPAGYIPRPPPPPAQQQPQFGWGGFPAAPLGVLPPLPPPPWPPEVLRAMQLPGFFLQQLRQLQQMQQQQQHQAGQGGQGTQPAQPDSGGGRQA